MRIKTRVFIININNYNIDDLSPYIDGLYKKDRINRFKFNDDKVKTILSEILVRTIYCETKDKLNSQIIFDETEMGKPFIKNEENFKYNISHSGNRVVVVFDDEEIGVDIEDIKELNLDVVRSFSTDYEYEKTLQKSHQGRGEHIISIWVLKEAYVKYLGTGLNQDFQSFDVINKDNIKVGVNLYKKKMGEYILGICTKKFLNLDKCIEEVTIEDLLNRYSDILN